MQEKAQTICEHNICKRHLLITTTLYYQIFELEERHLSSSGQHDILCRGGEMLCR